MSFLMVGLTVASGAISAYGSYQAGQQQQAVAEYNAKQLEMNAEAERANAGVREDQQRAEARRQIGRQLAAGAESGTALSGSSADLFRQSLFNAEQDALAVRYEGESRARGLEGQAVGELFGGKMAAKAGKINALTTLASTAVSGYGAYGKYAKPSLDSGIAGGGGFKPKGGAGYLTS